MTEPDVVEPDLVEPEVGAFDGEAFRRPDRVGRADDGWWNDSDEDPSAASRRVADRPGPSVLDSDDWDSVPDVAGENDSYQGRRRVGAPSARIWFAIAFILVALGIAVAVPLALKLSDDVSTMPPTGNPSDAGGPGLGESASGTPPPSPTISPSASSQPVQAAPKFVSVSYEAEGPKPAITRAGSARVRINQNASGRRIVNRIGDWSESEDTEASNGTLTFNTVTVPADGTYTLAIFYAIIEEDASRTAMITVNGAAPISVSFTRQAECCSSRYVSITLRKGVNTILFANSVSRAPAIDRIVISRA